VWTHQNFFSENWRKKTFIWPAARGSYSSFSVGRSGRQSSSGRYPFAPIAVLVTLPPPLRRRKHTPMRSRYPSSLAVRTANRSPLRISSFVPRPSSSKSSSLLPRPLRPRPRPRPRPSVVASEPWISSASNRFLPLPVDCKM